MIPAQYQQFKLFILDLLPISRDAIHIHVGFFTYLAFLILLRKKPHQWSALLPPFILSLVMEALDFWDELNTIGHLLIGNSVHDIVNTNLIPLVLVVYARRYFTASAR